MPAILVTPLPDPEALIVTEPDAALSVIPVPCTKLVTPELLIVTEPVDELVVIPVPATIDVTPPPPPEPLAANVIRP